MLLQQQTPSCAESSKPVTQLQALLRMKISVLYSLVVASICQPLVPIPICASHQRQRRLRLVPTHDLFKQAWRQKEAQAWSPVVLFHWH